MSLPQTVTDDLALLDSDAAATATAQQADSAADAALTAAQTTKQGTAADLTKAQTAQGQQLSKVIADLNAAYGVPTPTT